jgi:hypothetical protein
MIVMIGTAYHKKLPSLILYFFLFISYLRVLPDPSCHFANVVLLSAVKLDEAQPFYNECSPVITTAKTSLYIALGDEIRATCRFDQGSFDAFLCHSDLQL